MAMALEVKDGVIAGDVHTGDVHHHHHHVSPQPQFIMQQQARPVVIVQKSGPNPAAPIIGTLCIVWGGINSLLAIPMFTSMNRLVEPSDAMMLSVGGTAFSLFAIIVGGVLIAVYRRGGIYLIWSGFLIGIILDGIAFSIQGGYALEQFYGGSTVIITSMIFTLICGFIVAIPLLIPNNGMK